MKQVPDEAVPQHMKTYCQCTSRTRGEGKKLVGALSAQKLLLYAPLLWWYVGHGVNITAVHCTIDYQATKIFAWFGEQVTEAQRTGDTDKSKALLSEVFKLLGNSVYGEMLEAVECQTCVVFKKVRSWSIGRCAVGILKTWMNWAKPTSSKAGNLR